MFMNKGSFISKEEAIMLQGIAVIFMVIHHLLGFPERIAVEYNKILDFNFFHLDTVLGYFGRICIAIFAFISGYGIMKKMQGNYTSKVDVLKKGYSIAIQQLKKFYSIYWIVFFAFIPYGMINHTYSFKWIQFIKNFFGISSTYNAEWWYVRIYLQMILIFPLCFLLGWSLKTLKKGWIINGFMLIGFVVCLLGNQIPNHSFISIFYCFLLGGFIVYYSIFEKIAFWIKNNKMLGYFFTLMLFLIAVYIRVSISQNIDYIIVPVIVFGLVMILKSSICLASAKYILMKIGKYSTYIWLIHTFFAYYYWQKYLYIFRYSTLIIIVCIVSCIIIGMILESLKKRLLDWIKRRCLK